MGNKEWKGTCCYIKYFSFLWYFSTPETCPIKSPFSLQQGHSGPSKKPPHLVLCQVVLSLPSQPSSGKVVSNVPNHISYLLLPLTQNYSIVTSLAATPTSFFFHVTVQWHFTISPVAFWWKPLPWPLPIAFGSVPLWPLLCLVWRLLFSFWMEGFFRLPVNFTFLTLSSAPIHTHPSKIDWKNSTYFDTFLELQW